MTFRSSAGAAATGAGVVAGVTPAGASSTVVASTAASGAAAVPGAARYVSGMSPGCRSVGGVLVVVTLPASASAPAAGAGSAVWLLSAAGNSATGAASCAMAVLGPSPRQVARPIAPAVSFLVVMSSDRKNVV